MLASGFHELDYEIFKKIILDNGININFNEQDITLPMIIMSVHRIWPDAIELFKDVLHRMNDDTIGAMLENLLYRSTIMLGEQGNGYFFQELLDNAHRYKEKFIEILNQKYELKYAYEQVDTSICMYLLLNNKIDYFLTVCDILDHKRINIFMGQEEKEYVDRGFVFNYNNGTRLLSILNNKILPTSDLDQNQRKKLEIAREKLVINIMENNIPQGEQMIKNVLSDTSSMQEYTQDFNTMKSIIDIIYHEKHMSNYDQAILIGRFLLWVDVMSGNMGSSSIELARFYDLLDIYNVNLSSQIFNILLRLPVVEKFFDNGIKYAYAIVHDESILLKSLVSEEVDINCINRILLSETNALCEKLKTAIVDSENVMLLDLVTELQSDALNLLLKYAVENENDRFIKSVINSDKMNEEKIISFLHEIDRPCSNKIYEHDIKKEKYIVNLLLEEKKEKALHKMLFDAKSINGVVSWVIFRKVDARDIKSVISFVCKLDEIVETLSLEDDLIMGNKRTLFDAVTTKLSLEHLEELIKKLNNSNFIDDIDQFLYNIWSNNIDIIKEIGDKKEHLLTKVHETYGIQAIFISQSNITDCKTLELLFSNQKQCEILFDRLKQFLVHGNMVANPKLIDFIEYILQNKFLESSRQYQLLSNAVYAKSISLINILLKYNVHEQYESCKLTEDLLSTIFKNKDQFMQKLSLDDFKDLIERIIPRSEQYDINRIDDNSETPLSVLLHHVNLKAPEHVKELCQILFNKGAKIFIDEQSLKLYEWIFKDICRVNDECFSFLLDNINDNEWQQHYEIILKTLLADITESKLSLLIARVDRNVDSRDIYLNQIFAVICDSEKNSNDKLVEKLASLVPSLSSSNQEFMIEYMISTGKFHKAIFQKISELDVFIKFFQEFKASSILDIKSLISLYDEIVRHTVKCTDHIVEYSAIVKLLVDNFSQYADILSGHQDNSLDSTLSNKFCGSVFCVLFLDKFFDEKNNSIDNALLYNQIIQLILNSTYIESCYVDEQKMLNNLLKKICNEYSTVTIDGSRNVSHVIQKLFNKLISDLESASNDKVESVRNKLVDLYVVIDSKQFDTLLKQDEEHKLLIPDQYKFVQSMINGDVDLMNKLLSAGNLIFTKSVIEQFKEIIVKQNNWQILEIFLRSDLANEDIGSFMKCGIEHFYEKVIDYLQNDDSLTEEKKYKWISSSVTLNRYEIINILPDNEVSNILKEYKYSIFTNILAKQDYMFIVNAIIKGKLEKSWTPLYGNKKAIDSQIQERCKYLIEKYFIGDYIDADSLWLTLSKMLQVDCASNVSGRDVELAVKVKVELTKLVIDNILDNDQQLLTSICYLAQSKILEPFQYLLSKINDQSNLDILFE